MPRARRSKPGAPPPACDPFYVGGESAVRRAVQTFAGEMAVNGAVIDLRHAELEPGRWFADITITKWLQGIVVTWRPASDHNSSPTGIAVLTAGDRLMVSDVKKLPENPLVAPADRYRAEITLCMHANGKIQAPQHDVRLLIGHPNALDSKVGTGCQTHVRLGWRLSDLMVQKQTGDDPLSGNFGDERAKAEAAWKAMFDAEDDLRKRLYSFAGRVSPEVLAELNDYYDRAREAIGLGAAFGYAQAEFEAAAGVRAAADGMAHKLHRDTSRASAARTQAAELKPRVFEIVADVVRRQGGRTHQAECVKKCIAEIETADGLNESHVHALIRDLFQKTPGSRLRRPRPDCVEIIERYQKTLAGLT